MDKTQFKDIRSRQKKLLKSLGNDLLILPAGAPAPGVGRFRQDSYFSYLTGFPEQGAVAVFDPSQDTERVCLFVREKDRQDEVWNGFTIGVKQTGDSFPADKAHDIKHLESVLKKRLKGRTVFYNPPPNHPQHARLDKLLKDQEAEVHAEGEVFDRLAEMRLIKSSWELKQIRQAIAITRDAHHACMRVAKTHRFEYQFEAEFDYACKTRGALHVAFGTIVAAGPHGTCQHYVDNAGPVGATDLVLIDAGAAWNGYCADITRTFPASGTFTPVQRDFYAVVLAAQKAGLDMVAPGVRFHDLQIRAATVLVDGLKDLKLLHGATAEIIEKDAYRDFWPAGLSHSLGLDVHDVTPSAFRGRDAERTLEAGMVITVEPGFYSQDFNHQISEDIKGIGIRIEDDVLVTETGHENLSADVVKEVDDVERMIQG
ncbi:MAG: aminopeptidase P family protein [Lentisphaeria bacterium]|nr:aminopeptidase P family protein [Lentisphaeria bacterium]